LTPLYYTAAADAKGFLPAKKKIENEKFPEKGAKKAGNFPGFFLVFRAFQRLSRS
jgi:hypothetical protein